MKNRIDFEKQFNFNLKIIVALACVFSVFALSGIQRNDFFDFRSNWKLICDEKNSGYSSEIFDFTSDSIKKTSNNTIKISKQIPKSLKSDQILVLRSKYQYISLLINDRTIYQYPNEEKNIFQVSNYDYVIIPITQDLGGEHIVIKMEMAYTTNMYHPVNMVYFGTTEDFLFKYTSSHLYIWILSVLFLMLSGLMLVICTKLKLQAGENGKKIKNLVLLSLMGICTGLCFFTRYQDFSLYGKFDTFRNIVSYIVIYIFPILWLRLLYNISEEKYHKIVRKLCWIYSIFLIGVFFWEIFSNTGFAYSRHVFDCICIVLFPFGAVILIKIGRKRPIVWHWMKLSFLIMGGVILDVFLLQIFPGGLLISSAVIASTAVIIEFVKLTVNGIVRLYDERYVSYMIYRQLEKQQIHYNVLHEQIEKMAFLRHDLRNHIKTVTHLLEQHKTDEAGRYLKEIEGISCIPKDVIHTGNPTLDAILTEKKFQAENRGINMIMDLKIDSNLNIRPLDWCAIMGNALDNAIEACEHSRDVLEIIVRLKLNEKFLSGYISNPCDRKQLDKIHFLSSVKGIGHGIGLKSMKQAVERYRGEIQIKCKENIVILRFLLLGIESQKQHITNEKDQKSYDRYWQNNDG